MSTNHALYVSTRTAELAPFDRKRAEIQPRNMSDVFEWLSNAEFAAVCDGGSARVVISDSYGNEFDGWISMDGVWCSDESEPGHLTSLRGWTISRHY